MDLYDILGVAPNADAKKLKLAYLRAAKKYHPDIYHGVNQNHFTMVNEAYNTLKFTFKRQEYDRKQKITRMRDSKEFKAEAQKMKMKGMEFTHEMYMKMKKTAQKERVVREE